MMGWKFPVQVDDKTGKIKMSDLQEDVRESIKIILGTARGERVMNPDFGCDLQDFSFQSTDATTLGLLENNIKDAIMKWEPRVEGIQADVSEEPGSTGTFIISLSYRLKVTSEIQNQQLPLDWHEGT